MDGQMFIYVEENIFLVFLSMGMAVNILKMTNSIIKDYVFN